jgi:hypothetical protein
MAPDVEVAEVVVASAGEPPISASNRPKPPTNEAVNPLCAEERLPLCHPPNGNVRHVMCHLCSSVVQDS